MRIFQKGFNFGQDGPGNRLVYHLQGCNMRCIWCSNPEGMSFDGGQEYSCEDIVNECVRSRLMMFSGGGVTFTGGEATVQAEDLINVLAELKMHNIHTCAETNGTSSRLEEIAGYIDYLIMDFKHYDSDVLRQFTGVGNEQIKKNFEMLCRNGRQAHIRIPLINGFNTDNPRGFAEYFANYDTSNIVFEFLRYHEYGKNKWTEEYRVENGFVKDSDFKEFLNVFREYGLETIIT